MKGGSKRVNRVPGHVCHCAAQSGEVRQSWPGAERTSFFVIPVVPCACSVRIKYRCPRRGRREGKLNAAVRSRVAAIHSIVRAGAFLIRTKGARRTTGITEFALRLAGRLIEPPVGLTIEVAPPGGAVTTDCSVWGSFAARLRPACPSNPETNSAPVLTWIKAPLPHRAHP